MSEKNRETAMKRIKEMSMEELKRTIIFYRWIASTLRKKSKLVGWENPTRRLVYAKL